MSAISLTAGVRQNLLALQSTADLFTKTSNRLATGKKVNSALDNPNNFFTAQGLEGRASDLSGLLDGLSNAVQTVTAANNGITGIQKLVESARALTSQAKQTADLTVRADLATQFDALLTQIDQLADDSGFNGVNLLNGDDLDVTFNETATSKVTITAVTNHTSGVGASIPIATAANNFATNADVDAAVAQLTTATNTLRTQAKTFGSNLAVVQTRQDFMKATINTLQVGADNLTLADTNEEGANLTALQTRSQISTVSLSLLNQQNQAVLRLFS